MSKKYSVEHYCRYCRTITSMDVVSEQLSFDSYWLKCQKCHVCTMIRKKELEEKEIITNSIKSTNNKNDLNKKQKEYNPTKTYELGQKLYHPKYKDKGKVIKKLAGSGSYNKIIVKFDNIGEKTLVEGFSNKE